MVVQRRVKRRWRTATSDLGVQMLWKVDDDGRFTAQWEIPRSTPRGVYRLSIRAKRYRLDSRRFRVRRNEALKLERVPARAGRVAVRLAYPAAVRDVDTTYRPPFAAGGKVRFIVGGRRVTVRRKRSTIFSVGAPAGASVTVPAAGAADRLRNVAASGLRLR